MIKLTRRAVMMAAAASGLPSLSWAENLPAIHVVEGSGCECCKQWTNYLRENGFQVTSEERFGTLLMQHKIDLGVPDRTDFLSYRQRRWLLPGRTCPC